MMMTMKNFTQMTTIVSSLPMMKGSEVEHGMRETSISTRYDPYIFEPIFYISMIIDNPK